MLKTIQKVKRLLILLMSITLLVVMKLIIRVRKFINLKKNMMPTAKAVHIYYFAQANTKPKIAKEYAFANAERNANKI